ncbi:MAG: aminoacyltransferase [Dysgonamonadaceae bacterium]|jgi:hypothetical protein|nr:aminoacyltransferase [Dysgonamonadaceae bacterium]
MEIIGLENSYRWNEIVRSMKRYDFYHLAEYSALDSSGKPLLLYHTSGNRAFALPVILRKIADTEFNDITSVYGYAGPLSNMENPDCESVKSFHQELRTIFNSQAVVSVFARLHSIFKENEKLISGLGSIREENLTVGIDLKQPENEQLKQYSYWLRRDIKRLKKNNFQVREIANENEISEFVKIYYENMQRLNASEYYFFSESYFKQFMKTIPSFLLIATIDNEIVSGSLCSECNGIIQVHLSATKTSFLRYSPQKYVWDKVREYGMTTSARYIHFGGGYAGKNDTLFQFKSKFSHQRFMFKTWRYIHLPKIYDKLVAENTNLNTQSSSFFPLYRAEQ